VARHSSLHHSSSSTAVLQQLSAQQQGRHSSNSSVSIAAAAAAAAAAASATASAAADAARLADKQRRLGRINAIIEEVRVIAGEDPTVPTVSNSPGDTPLRMLGDVERRSSKSNGCANGFPNGFPNGKTHCSADDDANSTGSATSCSSSGSSTSSSARRRIASLVHRFNAAVAEDGQSHWAAARARADLRAARRLVRVARTAELRRKNERYQKSRRLSLSEITAGLQQRRQASVGLQGPSGGRFGPYK
jgi:hypothetical protein